MYVAKNTHINFSENDFIERIASRIKELRIKAGYSSYENFALDNDLDRKQYWRVEKGSNLTLKTLKKILNKLNVSEKEFFEGIF